MNLPMLRPLLFAVLLLAPASLEAVGTERFVLDSERDLSDGTLEGASVDSSGHITAGAMTERFPLEGVTTGRALLTTRDGVTYVGAGTSGQLYKLEGDALKPNQETGAMMVTALAEGRQGELYVGTTPKGQVFKLSRKGKLEAFVTLPETEHIWSLAYRPKTKDLFAATGPKGRIYRISANGKAEVYYQTEASHVMTLALTPKGRLFAGTTEEALLLEVLGPERARVVYDFEGNELTAIAVSGNALAVVENRFPDHGQRKETPKPSAPKNPISNHNPEGKPEAKPKKTPKANNNKPSKGQLWRVTLDGQATHLFESPTEHISALAFHGEDILVGDGAEGQIYRVHPDGTHALWIDVDERQILALQVTRGQTSVLTGDGTALYRTVPLDKQPARWVSKTLDAEFPARFGQLTFRKKGNVAFQTRSGNTAAPDGSWSPWSSEMTKPGPIRSPGARFLQIRATLQGDAQVFAIGAYYLPHNQPPIVHSVRAAPATDKKNNGTAAHTRYEVRWEADSVDDDLLRYRIFYRPEAEQAFRPLLLPHQNWTKGTFTWNTDSVPDGYYVLRVDASDELANGAAYTQTHSALSEPVLVDNHPPQITELKRQRDQVRGVASDSLGPIRTLEYKIDQAPWQPLLPEDDMLDTAREPFALTLPTDLAAGPHVVAIRAQDDRHNRGSAELEFVLP